MRRLAPLPTGLLLLALVACGGAAPPAPASTSTQAPTTLAPAVPSASGAASSPASVSDPSAGVPRQGGVLVVGKTDEAPSIDTLENANASMRLTSLLYDNLVFVDEKLQLQPMLAESWDIADGGKVYTFKLRKGVKFHNGRELEAADVKYTLERVSAENSSALQKQDAQQVASTELPDKYTAKMTLKAPSAGFLSAMANFNMRIVAHEVVEQNGDLKKVEAGTGPYMLESWTIQQSLKMKKFADYWDKTQGHVDQVVFQIVPDEASIVAGLRGGTIGYAVLLDNKNYAVLAKEKSLTTERAQSLDTHFIWTNNQRPPLNNVKVRQAISYALDRKAFLEAAAAGIGRLTAPLPPIYGDWALPSSELDKYYTRDLAKAKQLLAEAGYANGAQMSMSVVSSNPDGVAVAQMTAANLKDIGIDVKIELLDYSIWVKKVLRPSLDYWLSSGSAPGYTDPDTYFYSRFHTGGFNLNNLNDPEIDALLDEGRVTTDPARRREVYLKLQRMLLDKAVTFYLYSGDQVNVRQASVKGFVPHPTGLYYPLRKVWIEQ